jgi:WD40 repeat protein
MGVLRGHDGRVTSAAFSPEGSRIVTASADKTARIWDIRLQTMSANDLLGEVCRRLSGKFTREEMRPSSYPDGMPEIDLCKEQTVHEYFEQASPVLSVRRTRQRASC